MVIIDVILGSFFPGTILLGLAIYFSLITVIDKNLIWDFSNRLSLIVILIVPSILFYLYGYLYLKRKNAKRKTSR